MSHIPGPRSDATASASKGIFLGLESVASTISSPRGIYNPKTISTPKRNYVGVFRCVLIFDIGSEMAWKLLTSSGILQKDSCSALGIPSNPEGSGFRVEKNNNLQSQSFTLRCSCACGLRRSVAQGSCFVDYGVTGAPRSCRSKHCRHLRGT